MKTHSQGPCDERVRYDIDRDILGHMVLVLRRWIIMMETPRPMAQTQSFTLPGRPVECHSRVRSFASDKYVSHIEFNQVETHERLSISNSPSGVLRIVISIAAILPAYVFVRERRKYDCMSMDLS